VLRPNDLGVAILAYGRSNRHAELIRNLCDGGLREERLIVVHNPDRPPDGWRPACPDRSSLIALPRNLGYATAMNKAISAFAKQGLPAALLLTHDARLEPNTLEKLLEAANAAPRYGVLGLAVRGAGGASTSYGAAMGTDGIVRHTSERPAGKLVADAMLVDGSAMFLRLAACGSAPMPERYFMYFEEAEVCASVQERGWGVGTALNATASSISGTSRRRAAFQYLYVRNGLDWVCRHQGKRAALAYVKQHVLGAWRDIPKPGGRRFRDPKLRRAGYEQIFARLLGLTDYVRRRWGPPPETLLRMSDIRNI
jgi:GT2 family glycosyltransferase